MMRKPLLSFAFIFLGLLTLSSPAQSLPSGLKIIEGEVHTESPDTSSLNVQVSDRAILEWESFSIAGGETMRFNQPGFDSSVLSRVAGGTPSEIFGSLFSNGELVLVNPWGIHFGPSAQVEVGSLV